MAATTSTLVLLVVFLLPLTALSSRGGPPSHRSHGGHGNHSPPPAPVAPAAPVAPPVAPPAAALVRATCNSTAYYDLCVAALAADPSSSTADVRGLSAIVVSAAAANASGSAAAAAALANATGTAAQTPAATDVTVKSLLRTCAAKYAEASEALSSARSSIAQQDYDFAAVHVSAAGEYPQVCRTLFQRQRPGSYPPELAAREVVLKQLCSVALDIITLLSNTTS